MPSRGSSLTKPVFLSNATRSPIGAFGGALLSLSAPVLAAKTLKAAIQKDKRHDTIDYVFMGHARQAGGGPNTARQATIFAGLPETTPAATVNQACASGMIAVITGIEKILSGRGKNIWAGGVESMSNTPYFLMGARWGEKFGNKKVVDGMYKDGFFCPMAEMVMGETVERVIVPEYKISRADQDAYALESQKRAENAFQKGFSKKEFFEIPAEGKFPGLNTDEHRRPESTLETLKKLSPVFDKSSGTLTAGNSSGITDGAAFLKVSDDPANALAEVLDYSTVALDPKRMGLGPVPAIQQILSKNKLTIADIDWIEINEAFAAQVLACQRDLKIPHEKLNPHGGSIALGHPIGASGARILVTLLHGMAGKKDALAIASLCVSGGQGVAILLRIS